MSKTLVTGASGFTGGAICKRLVEHGEQVVAFVRPTSRIEDLKALGVEVRQTDIRDPNDVKDKFHGIDRVYHIAAAWRAEHKDRDEYRRVNVEATRNLLEAAKKAKVKRFVHCSTVGVQGHIDDCPADEAYRFNPGDHYQRTKLGGELVAREYMSEGLPVVIVRPAGIYGPGDVRFLKLFRPIQKGFFIMIGSGRTLYHFTYIDDLVEGFMLAGKKPEALGEVFIIAGEHYLTLNELVGHIADVLGKPHPKLKIPFYPVYVLAQLCDLTFRPLGLNPPIFPRRVEFFCKDRAFTIEKAKRILGYQPKVGVRDGLANTASWYKERGLLQ